VALMFIMITLLFSFAQNRGAICFYSDLKKHNLCFRKVHQDDSHQ
jgi:hypothetical protein